jgi:hypothetical protein
VIRQPMHHRRPDVTARRVRWRLVAPVLVAAVHWPPSGAVGSARSRKPASHQPPVP